MLSCLKQNEHGEQTGKPWQVWWQKVENTIFPTLECALHLVQFCSKSLGVVSKLLLPLPPRQTALFPKSKSEIWPQYGQWRCQLQVSTEECCFRRAWWDWTVGLSSPKCSFWDQISLGKTQLFLLPKEDVSLQPPSAHGSFLSQSIRGFSLFEIFILILAGMSSLFT